MLRCSIREILNISYLTLSRKSVPTLALEENEGKGFCSCLKLLDSDRVHPVRIFSYHYLAGTSTTLPVPTCLVPSVGSSSGLRDDPSFPSPDFYLASDHAQQEYNSM